jgi:hypothetical protein
MEMRDAMRGFWQVKCDETDWSSIYQHWSDKNKHGSMLVQVRASILMIFNGPTLAKLELSWFS